MTNLSPIAHRTLAVGSNDYSLQIIKDVIGDLQCQIEFNCNLNHLMSWPVERLLIYDFLIISACCKTKDRHDFIDNMIRFFNGLPTITILEHKSDDKIFFNNKFNEKLLKLTEANLFYELKFVFPLHGKFLIGNIHRIIESFDNFSKANLGLDFGLTNREEELLLLLKKGKSYKACATSMNISLSTVQTHIRNLYRKLNVRNNREAVTKALSF